MPGRWTHQEGGVDGAQLSGLKPLSMAQITAWVRL